MKKKSVLIYGEFSGYGKSLVKGFRHLGYKADVLNFNGDGFKKIKGDLSLSGNSKIKKLISLIKLIPKILKYKNILIMNPAFLNINLLGPIIIFLLKLKRSNIILLCCGDDVEFIRTGNKGMIKNWPYADINLPYTNYYSKKSDIFIHHLTALSVRKIIPVMYDYAYPWRLSKYKSKVTETIPLACDGSVIENISDKDKNTPITIMHGINREDFKGSNVIKEALKIIKEKYGDNVDVIYPEKLPFNVYMEMIKSIDISIDQTKSNSYGMNAIYSMLAGHIVLAPANNEFKNDLGINDCPVISISNKSEDIVAKIEWILDNPSSMRELKEKTVEFAKKTHDPVKIASMISSYLI